MTEQANAMVVICVFAELAVELIMQYKSKLHPELAPLANLSDGIHLELRGIVDSQEEETRNRLNAEIEKLLAGTRKILQRDGVFPAVKSRSHLRIVPREDEGPPQPAK